MMQLQVLDIDDSNIIFKYMSAMIQTLKNIHLIDHAFTISEAKKFLKNNLLDVVVMDIALKEENGIDFLNYIKNKYPVTEVVIFTNESDLFYRKKCKSLGAYAFFDKSYELDKLSDCLEEILQNKKNATSF